MQSRVLAILVAVVLALVATAALVVYVNGADRRAISDQSPVEVWVAVKPIPAGTTGLSASNTGLIDTVEMAKKNAVDGGVLALSQIQNKRAMINIVPGEQLLLSRWVEPSKFGGQGLLTIPPEHQAVSIALELTRQVAGFVTPGDLVTLVVSGKAKNKQSDEEFDATEILLQNVQVLAVGSTALANPSAQGGNGRVNQGKGGQNLTAVTLSIHQDDVPRVVYAAEYNSIYLTLMPPGAEEVAIEGANPDNVIPPPSEQ